MLKIGHRGAKGYAAENTLASFEKAIALGCDGIELDVWLTIDDEVIVIHDETINRTTNGNGKINNLFLAEIAVFDIPTLEDVIKIVNHQCFINIEIKDPKATQFVLKIIENQINNFEYSYNDFIVSSFHFEILENVFNYNSQIKIAVLTENSIENAIAFAEKINAFAINPYYKLLNQENVTLCQQKGFKIFTWTVNEKADIEKIKLLKVDGIISDFPDRI